MICLECCRGVGEREVVRHRREGEPLAKTTVAVGYRDVFAVGEYRSLFAANALSLLGDQLTIIAASFLIFQSTGSALLSSAVFGVGYLAWLVGGPLLSGYADRIPSRQLMVGCDLIRAALVPLMALPRMPPGPILALLLVISVLRPPFKSARAALVPRVLEGERYPLANGLDNLVNQVGQVVGFSLGGYLVVAFTPRYALLIDAATFLVSGTLLRLGLQRRPSAAGGRYSGVRRFGRGVTTIFGDRRLRAYVILFWTGTSFCYAFEGIVAPLSTEYGGAATVGGLLLAVAPAGMTVGGLLITRVVGPTLRFQLIVPLALISSAALLPVVLHPPLWMFAGLLLVVGLSSAFSIPLNAIFVRALPAESRGSAFGVAATGQTVLQAIIIAAAGAAADAFTPTAVVAACSALGCLCVLAVTRVWPAAPDPS
jgi:predicted MFS family arabinose efflux permease